MAHRIQNFEALATNARRTDALLIAEAGYAAIDVGGALARTLHLADNALRVGEKTYLLDARRVFFVGIGKCAFAAARAVEDMLGDALTGGVALDVSPVVGRTPSTIETYVGTHPLPSDVNEDATKRIMEFLADRTPDDLVIMLISGGGSTLLCAHDAPMTCADESVLWNELTAKGATIQDINTVRKHTSRARGGGLAFAAFPAEVVGLIVSDVPGNDIGSIASGPTVLDATTADDARAVLARYGIRAAHVALAETPKDPKYFERVSNTLFLSSKDALAAMQEAAAARGYTTVVVDDRYAGEARDVGRDVARKLHDAPPKTALLYAGEGTVVLSGAHGEGGRNQELALAALNELSAGELILPFASDGRDNTDAAGAIGDDATRAHVFAHNLSIEEYLGSHRAYDFFKATGDALLTGSTGSNVSDLIIALKN